MFLSQLLAKNSVVEHLDWEEHKTTRELSNQNQTVVEQEIRTLISDNQKLSQQVGMLLKERLETARSQDGEQSKELEELRRQVSLLTKERDSLHVLWQTSQKTIDALDTELKAYQGYDNRGLKQNPNSDHRDLELKLETALSDYVELESKYKEINIEYNNQENELKNKEKEISAYKERGKEIDNKMEELLKTLEGFKINLAAERKNNEDIKSQLLLCQKECVERVKKEVEAKSKVAEALQLYDLVSVQKNEAFKKVAEITEELLQMKQKLSDVKRETESKYRVEMEEIKDKYNEKVADMLQHIRNLDAELIEKGMLLNKALRENKILQTNNESYLKQQKVCLKAVDPKLALAEQRLEAMFQELVSSERRNIQLVCEKQCLALDIQRIQDIHTREIKRRDWEEKLLKNQCEELKLQVEHLQKSLTDTHELVNKLQNMLSLRTELSQKMLSTKEEELLELNKHLQNQIELSRKWKESYVEMTEKLNNRLKGMENENKELRSKLKLPNIESPNDEDSTNS